MAMLPRCIMMLCGVNAILLVAILSRNPPERPIPDI
jgi:hypothetical protein